jgi:hypothetical protein
MRFLAWLSLALLIAAGGKAIHGRNQLSRIIQAFSM